MQNHRVRSSSSSNNARPTFLGIPAELRLKIYKYSRCLTLQQCVICRATMSGDERDVRRLPPSVCLGCGISHANGNWDNTKYIQLFVPVNELVGGWDDTPLKAHLTQPAITRVCRKIRQETLSTWYEDHHWFFTSFPNKPPERPTDEKFPEATAGSTTEVRRDAHKDVVTWIRAIGPGNASSIRNLTLIYASLDMECEIECKLHLRLVNRGVGRDAFDWRVMREPPGWHSSVESPLYNDRTFTIFPETTTLDLASRQQHRESESDV